MQRRKWWWRAVGLKKCNKTLLMSSNSIGTSSPYKWRVRSWVQGQLGAYVTYKTRETFFLELNPAFYFVNFDISLLVLLSSVVIKVEAWRFCIKLDYYLSILFHVLQGMICDYCFDYQAKWTNQRRGEKGWKQCACKLIRLKVLVMFQVLLCLFPFPIHWLKPLQLFKRSHVLQGLIFTQTQCQHSLIARRGAKLVIRSDKMTSHLQIIMVLLWHSFHHLFQVVWNLYFSLSSHTSDYLTQIDAYFYSHVCKFFFNEILVLGWCDMMWSCNVINKIMENET